MSVHQVRTDAVTFAAWGMLEKSAPAILAGAPVILKPATRWRVTDF